MSEQTRAATKSGRRWLIGAGIAAMAGIVTYHLWRPGWDVFGVWFTGSMWWCIAEWSNERGFIRGWKAKAPAGREGICGDESSGRFVNCANTFPVICVLSHGHASAWHEGDNGMRWRKAVGRG